MVRAIYILQERELKAGAMPVKQQEGLSPSVLGNRSNSSIFLRKLTRSSEVIEPLSVLDTIQGTSFPQNKQNGP